MKDILNNLEKIKKTSGADFVYTGVNGRDSLIFRFYKGHYVFQIEFSGMEIRVADDVFDFYNYAALKAKNDFKKLKGEEDDKQVEFILPKSKR